jgi:hypothetical protein
LTAIKVSEGRNERGKGRAEKKERTERKKRNEGRKGKEGRREREGHLDYETNEQLYVKGMSYGGRMDGRKEEI